MNPDIVDAIARLRADSVLSARQVAIFHRVARGSLVSVRFEIKVLLYLGVLLLTSGVGLFVVEHHRSIGPSAVAAALTLGTAACLLWIVRKAPPFSWDAYVEAQFTVLGPRWAHHLLVAGGIYLLAAYRWDARTVLGLALTTLAAWRGLSVSLIHGSHGAGDTGELRASAIALGALYLALATLSARLEWKAHFEEVFGNAGLLLLLGALASGVLDAPAVREAWIVALLVAAGLVMWAAFRLRRSLYFAQGVLAAYLGIVRLLFALFRPVESSVPFFVAALLGIGALALIVAAHQRMSER
jgi:hypothetical protein